MDNFSIIIGLIMMGVGSLPFIFAPQVGYAGISSLMVGAYIFAKGTTL